ncbi:MAG: hypothetical protein JO115_04945 [Pseudonocardiales bacterium]|nr:hypothetical protein [Pseudonocardiales bacterium]
MAIAALARAPRAGQSTRDGVIPMTSRGQTVHQISYRLVCETLRRFLRRAAEAESGAVEGISSIGCRASAALYTLLLDHPIDRRGRCQSCRRSGAMIGPRGCRIHLTASYWLLLQLDHAMLLSQLVGLRPGPPLSAGPPPDRSLLTITARRRPDSGCGGAHRGRSS